MSRDRLAYCGNGVEPLFTRGGRPMFGSLIVITGAAFAQPAIVEQFQTTSEGRGLLLRSLQQKPSSELTIEETRLLLYLKEREYDLRYNDVARRQDNLGKRIQTEEERMAEARLMLSELLRLKAEREHLRHEWAALHRREASATKK